MVGIATVEKYLAVGFLGSTRYSWPLDTGAEKKFRVLKSSGEIFVIGFSQGLCPWRFTENAHFYLLPKLPLRFLRYVEMLTVGLLLASWLIFRHGVQVLIAQSPYEGFSAAWAKKLAGWLGHRVILVVESHGDFEQSLFLQRRIQLPRLYHFLMHYSASFSLKHADVLRVISNSTKGQLERWIRGKTVVQFPTWTDIDVFLRSSLSVENHSCHDILYAGVLIPLKGVHHLINAFAHIARDFPESSLVIIGREENKIYAAELRKQVRQLALDGRVQFVGEVPQVELAASMRRACVFVLPSVSEGLGRVVVEAMATGTPVIASDVGGIPEMVENGTRGFLVPPGDEAELAERLRWVLRHSEEAYEMGRRAHAFAERFFSTEAYMQGYKQVFEVARGLLTGQGENASFTL
jgi:glycosyltransferase involved in cell wall biosynthesis